MLTPAQPQREEEEEKGKRAREGSIEEPTACITSHLIGGDHSARRSAAAEKGRLDLRILTACCHPDISALHVPLSRRGNGTIHQMQRYAKAIRQRHCRFPLIRGSGEGRRVLAAVCSGHTLTTLPVPVHPWQQGYAKAIRQLHCQFPSERTHADSFIPNVLSATATASPRSCRASSKLQGLVKTGCTSKLDVPCWSPSPRRPWCVA